MKKKNIVIAALSMALMMAACGPNKDKDQAQIQQLEDSIYHSGMVVLDTVMGNNLVTLYSQYADKYPDDAVTPGYLFNAADIAANMCHYEASIEMLTRVIENYDTVSNLGDCYFALAQAYESSSNYAKAKETYQLFVEKFADHPLADDIRTMMEQNLIGLSPEEALAQILQNASSEE